MNSIPCERLLLAVYVYLNRCGHDIWMILQKMLSFQGSKLAAICGVYLIESDRNTTEPLELPEYVGMK
jgi:hypothetical protein